VEEDVVPIAPGIELDVHFARVREHGRIIWLSPLQCRVLACLARRRGQVVPFRDIAQEWDPGARVGEHDVHAVVHRLREKLGSDPETLEIIVSIHGLGYMIPR